MSSPPPRFFPVHGALTALLPLFFGIPTRGDFWGPLNFNEIQVHVGVAALLAASLAPWTGAPRRGVGFFAVTCVVGVSVGYDLPPLGPLLSWIPPFSLIASQRCLPVVMFAVAALAAVALDGLGSRRSRGRAVRIALTLAFGAGTLVVVCLLAWRSSPGRVAGRVGLETFGLLVAATLLLLLYQLWRRSLAGGLGLVAVEMASVVPVALLYQPVIPTSLFYPAPPAAIRHVQAETAITRDRVLNIGWNLGALYGLHDVRGYDGMTPRRMEQLVGPGTVGPLGNGGMDVTISPELPLFDFLGIRYVLAAPGALAPRAGMDLVYDGIDGRVYRNERALPRAFVVHRRRCVDDAGQRRLLHGHDVNLRAEVLIAHCAKAPAPGPPGRVATAELVAHQPQLVRIRVETDSPGYLILTDTWFPGWRATIDGRPARVLRANYAFRAASIDPGRHEVIFQYTPASFRVGALVGAASAGALLVLLGVRGRSGRRLP